MVTEQVLQAAANLADAGIDPKAPFRDGPPSEVARLGAAAQLFAVKTKCPCSACQALRKMADVTMSAVLEAGLEAVAAEPEPEPEPDGVRHPEVAHDAQGHDPPAPANG